VPTIDDVRAAEAAIRPFLDPAPLIRAYRLEQALQFPASRRIWLKDYGSTPVGSFKVYGALNWMARRRDDIGGRAVTAHSSGNFAAGIAYAGMCHATRVIIVMPDTAPQVKFALTASFGAEIHTYDIASDHRTGQRDALTAAIAAREQALQASPYDDPWVIAGNGVGGLEIGAELARLGRRIGRLYCAVSGGGLMAGHALAIHQHAPEAEIVGVEPAGADDFARSLRADRRERLERPTSICDGLLSYDVGVCNWPILRQHVGRSLTIDDAATCQAMAWLYQHHGLKSEPSGAIALAASLHDLPADPGYDDVVIVVSGRNADEARFREWIATPAGVA
jgi:threonine dehydratase